MEYRYKTQLQKSSIKGHSEEVQGPLIVVKRTMEVTEVKVVNRKRGLKTLIPEKPKTMYFWIEEQINSIEYGIKVMES